MESNDYEFESSGAVTLSPSMMTQVCAGDNLEFTCDITGTLLEWRFPLIGNRGRQAFHGILASDSSEAYKHQVIDNSTINITISRISAEDNPVSSRLLISPTTESHNGTEVTCVDVNSSPTVESSTTIVIFNMNIEPCQMNYTAIFAQAKYCKLVVIITCVYIVGIFNGRSSYVESDYAAICNDPHEIVTDENLTIESYNDNAVEGSTVTFRCSHGMEVKNATCSGNGEWEPQLSCTS
jgi:hypothetical protein